MVQGDFEEYLELFGIDQELSNAIENFASDRYYRLYIRWLGMVHDYLKAEDEDED